MQHQQTPARAAYDGTCLIVEDSEFDRERLHRVLARAYGGMQVEFAPSIEAARRALSAGDKALILLDNNLPDGLGANFALELACDHRHAQTPVIMLSDWPSPVMWEKAASAGVLYVVNKCDFDASYLAAALRALQGRNRQMH
ncbi:response regulator [Sulfitobacter sp. R18_1]|uniref:response regulator n=1 Tax=Sulfitobacter sp. R18_1 TaxID=2821104 RepID=UPI001ADBE497|nr:response regulator [Sulfitobacter sp. R18_1]MBO9431021.1 response regulator [Sulfitobacter sp. R18_1]